MVQKHQFHKQVENREEKIHILKFFIFSLYYFFLTSYFTFFTFLFFMRINSLHLLNLMKKKLKKLQNYLCVNQKNNSLFSFLSNLQKPNRSS